MNDPVAAAIAIGLILLLAGIRWVFDDMRNDQEDDDQ